MLALVVSNLLYPVVAVGVAVLLCLIIVLRHRRPKSVEANMRAFHKGLRALAPESNPTTKTSSRPAPRRVEQRRPPARKVLPGATLPRPSVSRPPLPGASVPSTSRDAAAVDELEAETG